MYNRDMRTETDPKWRVRYARLLVTQNRVREAHAALLAAQRDLARGLLPKQASIDAGHRCDRANSDNFSALADCMQYRMSLTGGPAAPDAGDPQTERS